DNAFHLQALREAARNAGRRGSRTPQLSPVCADEIVTALLPSCGEKPDTNYTNCHELPERRTPACHTVVERSRVDSCGFVSGADGIGDTEGKTSTGSSERAGKQASFKFVSRFRKKI